MAIVLELARCPRSIGGPDGRRLNGGEILRIWAMNLGEEFLRTDSSAGAMARRSWLGCLLVVTRLVGFHGGRVGGAGWMSRRPYLQAPASSVHATGLSRRKKSAHGISGKKTYFSGLGLPKRSSLHQLPLATVRWRSKLSVYRRGRQRIQMLYIPSIFCLTPGSSVTHDISHHKS